MGGSAEPRYYLLGYLEIRLGSKSDRAIKHWLLACEGGHPAALESIKCCFMKRTATKDDYEKALRSYQQYLEDIKSVERDEAFAYGESDKYLLSADDYKDGLKDLFEV